MLGLITSPSGSSAELVGLETRGAEWIVLRTRARQEKAVAEHLRARGVECFLPLSSHVRCYGHRKERVELPLFPNYVFLNGVIDDAWDAERSRRVAQIIPVPDQAALDWELSNIRRALEAGVELDAFAYLRVGVRVSVRAGALKGLEGFVESRSKLDRLVLKVDLLGRALSVEVDASLLDVLN